METMTCNKFLEKIIELLATQFMRLRDPITQIQIQIELNTPEVFEIISYFITISGKYKSFWNNLNGHVNVLDFKNCSDSVIKIYDMNMYQITNSHQFNYLYKYLKENNILNKEELDWLHDAIHDILMD